MKIGIVGGRKRHDFGFIGEMLQFFVQEGDIIISGGAEGVDEVAKAYAEVGGFELIEFLPKDITSQEIEAASTPHYRYNPYTLRNKKIAEMCDVLLAFPSKESSGTWNTISHARKAGKRMIIFPAI